MRWTCSWSRRLIEKFMVVYISTYMSNAYSSSRLVGGVNRIGDKSRLFSVVLSAFRDWTKQFRNFLSPTIFTCRQFCPHRRHAYKTRQDNLVLSMGTGFKSHKIWQRRESTKSTQHCLQTINVLTCIQKVVGFGLECITFCITTEIENTTPCLKKKLCQPILCSMSVK